MKSIIIENINQFNLVKNRFNLKNFNIITISPAVSLILKEKNIKHQIFNINKIYFQLNKIENLLNKNLFKYLMGLEKFLVNKNLIFNYQDKKIVEINFLNFMMVFHEIVTNFKIYDSILNENIKKNKIIYIINIKKNYFDLDNYQINPWIINLRNKYKNKLKIISFSQKKINQNQKANIILKKNLKDNIFSFLQFSKSILLNKKKNILIIGDYFLNIRNLLFSKKFVIKKMDIKKKNPNDFHWNKSMMNYKFKKNQKKYKILKKNFEEYNNKNIKSLRFINKKLKFNIEESFDLHIINLFNLFPQLYEKNKSHIKNFINKNEINFFIAYSLSNTLQKTAALVCKKLDIPIISIQHGGGYGTHNYTRSEFNDLHFSDYFLVYGRKYRFNKNKFLEKKTKLIPSGNIFLSNIANRSNYKKNKTTKAKKILYISDGNDPDYLNSCKRKESDFSLFEKQKLFFSNLNNKDLNITYRPFVGSQNLGFVNYLKNNIKHVLIDNNTNIYKQILQNDLIITDSSPGTVITDVLIFEKKLIVLTYQNGKLFYNFYKKILNKSCLLINNKNKIVSLSKKINNRSFVFPSKINPKNYKKKFLNLKKNNFLQNFILDLKNR